jgi:hypothetical protein
MYQLAWLDGSRLLRIVGWLKLNIARGCLFRVTREGHS